MRPAWRALRHHSPRTTACDSSTPASSNAVKCVPPQNKPLPAEIRRCNAYLACELRSLRAVRVYLALGQGGARCAAHGARPGARALSVRARARAHARCDTLPDRFVSLQPLQHRHAPADAGNVPGGGGARLRARGPGGTARPAGSGRDGGRGRYGLSVFDHKAYIASLPKRPGVYRMYGAGQELLYVGKARSLRDRVGTYFAARNVDPKVQALVQQISAIEVTVTNSETEALLLEYNLIKAHKPRFNIVLRDDKSFPYIHLYVEHEFPRLEFYRGARSAPGRYFGPFPNAGAVRDTLNQLQKLFRIRNCGDSFFANRSRPCLQHQIGRCSGALCRTHHARGVCAGHRRGGQGARGSQRGGERGAAGAHGGGGQPARVRARRAAARPARGAQAHSGRAGGERRGPARRRRVRRSSARAASTRSA